MTAPQEFVAKYALETDDERVEIFQLEFEADFSVTNTQIPLLQESNYVDDASEETLVKIGHWKGSEDQLIKEMIILAIPKGSPVKPGSAK